MRRRTGAPLVLLCAADGPAPEADLRVDDDAPTQAIAWQLRNLLPDPPSVPHHHTCGPLHLLPATRQAWWNDRPLPLTVHQFALLRRLVVAQGAVVTVAELAAAVYGQAGWQDTERIRAHVLRIRRRLVAVDPGAADVLATVRGVGFRLRTGNGLAAPTAVSPALTLSARSG